MSDVGAIRAFMFLVREHPSILHPAPPFVTAGQIRERESETHPCSLCGKLAEWVIVADSPIHPEEGKRWLDLCSEHNDSVRTACYLGEL
jgi:hypothetical protein